MARLFVISVMLNKGRARRFGKVGNRRALITSDGGKVVLATKNIMPQATQELQGLLVEVGRC